MDGVLPPSGGGSDVQNGPIRRRLDRGGPARRARRGRPQGAAGGQADERDPRHPGGGRCSPAPQGPRDPRLARRDPRRAPGRRGSGGHLPTGAGGGRSLHLGGLRHLWTQPQGSARSLVGGGDRAGVGDGGLEQALHDQAVQRLRRLRELELHHPLGPVFSRRLLDERGLRRNRSSGLQRLVVRPLGQLHLASGHHAGRPPCPPPGCSDASQCTASQKKPCTYKRCECTIDCKCESTTIEVNADAPCPVDECTSDSTCGQGGGGGILEDILETSGPGI